MMLTKSACRERLLANQEGWFAKETQFWSPPGPDTNSGQLLLSLSSLRYSASSIAFAMLKVDFGGSDIQLGRKRLAGLAAHL